MRVHLVFLSILCACNTRAVSSSDTRPNVEVRELVPSGAVPKLDVLFVIDNSDSMREEQESLAANFPRFMDVLSSIEGGLPSIHVGVISSEVGLDPYSEENCEPAGDDGVLQTLPRGACTPPIGGFIEDVVTGAGARQRNYEGTLAETFACIAALGTTGCGYEQHLEAMRRALDGSHPENAGFLRKDAYLAIVIVADEDDCSARDPEIWNPDPMQRALDAELGPPEYRCLAHGVLCGGAPPPRSEGTFSDCVPSGDSFLYHPREYVKFLQSLKEDPDLVVGAVIGGDPTPVGAVLTSTGLRVKPSCISESGEARPGIRLEHFVKQLGRNGRYLSICDGDLSEALHDIAETLIDRITTRCLGPGVDVDDTHPEEAGAQVDCTVSETRPSRSKVLPRCAMSDDDTPAPGLRPCWWAAAHPACGPDTSGFSLHVEYDGETPDGSRIVAQCRGT